MSVFLSYPIVDIPRGALAEQRLQQNSQGQVVYKLKTPYNNSTIHVVFTPLEFMARLAALSPPPWLNLTRYHGVFAPNHKLRPMIVKPRPKKQQDANKQLPDNFRLTWAERLKRVFNIDVETCAKCDGKAKIIATIKNPVVIKKIVDHLNSSEKAVSPSFQIPGSHALPFLA